MFREVTYSSGNVYLQEKLGGKSVGLEGKSLLSWIRYAWGLGFVCALEIFQFIFEKYYNWQEIN